MCSFSVRDLSDVPLGLSGNSTSDVWTRMFYLKGKGGWDGLVDKSATYQVLVTFEFNPQNPHGGRRELVYSLCLLTSSSPHTSKQINVIKRKWIMVFLLSDPFWGLRRRLHKPVLQVMLLPPSEECLGRTQVLRGCFCSSVASILAARFSYVCGFLS